MPDQNLVTPLTVPSAKKQITLPSGLVLTIREQNGNDDETISRMNSESGIALAEFISNIIQSNNAEGKRYTPAQIEAWRTNDQNYFLLASREFSLGPLIKVNFVCPTCQFQNPPFEEDLNPYLTGVDAEGKPFKYACPPYKDNGKEREFTLSSGRVIRYKYKTGAIDAKALEIDQSQLTLNSGLRMRDLSLRISEGKYQKIEMFNIFSAREMSEIRRDINENDPAFEAISEYRCTNPRCKALHKISLITQPDFFFPGAIS